MPWRAGFYEEINMTDYQGPSLELRARVALEKHRFHNTHSLGQNFILSESLLSGLLDEAAKLAADGVLRGAGLMKQFMAATFTDLVLRVALAVLLSRTSLGSVGIWCAWPVGWIIAAALSLLFYRAHYIAPRKT